MVEISKDLMDMLRELSNIGTGNASTALSKMLNCDVTTTVPTCQPVPYAEVAEMMGGAEKVVCAILVQFSGDVDGVIMLVLDLNAAVYMTEQITCELIHDECQTNYQKLVEALSPTEEIGNILIGSYLSSLGELMQFQLTPSIPMLAVDMSQAIMSLPASFFGSVGDYVLLLDTKFSNALNDIQGHFFMFPSLESYQKIVRFLQ